MVTAGNSARFLEEVWEHVTLEKIQNLKSSNCWKCIEIVNPTITTLFCIILNLLQSIRWTFLAPAHPQPTGLITVHVTEAGRITKYILEHCVLSQEQGIFKFKHVLLLQKQGVLQMDPSVRRQDLLQISVKCKCQRKFP